MNQNNYRVFHDLGANKIVFVGHGMDQILGTGTMQLAGEQSSANCSIFPPLRGAVAEAVMSVPDGRRLYIARLGELYTNLFHVEVLVKRVDELSAIIRDALIESKPQSLQNYQRRVDTLKQHIEERGKSLALQLADALKARDLRHIEPVHPISWQPKVQSGHPEFDQKSEGSRSNLLHISVSHGTAAGSWRTHVQLEPGRYRFEGELRTKDVEGANEAAGAGLRISGRRPVRQQFGSTDWHPFAYEFQVEGNLEVELICELRGLAGEAWFDVAKLQVVPVK